MKNHAFLRIFLVYWLLCAGTSVFAFQVADGTRPSLAPSAKYIFYWGKYQCDLSESTGFRGNMTLSPSAFRQLLVGAPKVWNGKDLVKNVTFKLENQVVSTADYLGQLAQLDATMTPKAQTGKVLHITELTLEEGISGAIDINIEASETPDNKMVMGYSPYQTNNFVNDQFLDRAVWGREEIYANSDRDYFTVREFWQTIRQEPAVEWKSYRKPQTLRSEVHFTAKDLTSFTVVERLEEGAYAGMLENLENYRYMVHPGAIVTLQLQTAEQYETLYKKVMSIVADDDPRLRLRRKRDLHKLTIQWGDWQENIPELYLTSYNTTEGEHVLADAPISRNSAISFSDVSRNSWGTNKPEFRIDDEPVSGDISFRIVVSDSAVLHVSSNGYNADAFSQFFSRNDKEVTHLQIDSIQIEGYELPAMQFSVRLLNPNEGLLVRNNFEMLQQLAGNTTRIKLFAPVLNDSGIALKFELPEKSPATLSIFEPNGTNVFSQHDTYTPGETTVRALRSIFKNKGKHIAFLNTVFGVEKVEFEVN